MRIIGLGLACMLLLTSCSSSDDAGASGLGEKLLGILHEYDEAVKQGHWQRQREFLHPKELDILDAAMSFHGVKVDEHGSRENPPHGSSELAEALASPEKIVIEQDGSWARLVYPLKGGRGIVPALSQVLRVPRTDGGSKEEESEPARPADESVARRLLSEAGPWLAAPSHRHSWAWS